MKNSILLALTAVLSSFSLCAADVATGKALFAQKCKSCHGAEGQGNPAIAKMMKVALHPLGGKEVAAKSDDDIKKLIVDGKGKMKPVAGVSEVQASDIVAFVRTLK